MPEQKPEFHAHPRNMHDKVYGVKLKSGDVIEENDVYDASNGFWERSTCPGATLQGEGSIVTWIRPMPMPADTIFYTPQPGNPPIRTFEKAPSDGADVQETEVRMEDIEEGF